MSFVRCLLIVCCIDVMFGAVLNAHIDTVPIAEDSRICNFCSETVGVILTRDPGVLSYRCARCEERRKEERNAFAQKILTHVAQFLQGIFILANSGRDAEPVAKASQVAMMAQAVGSIIYESHQYDRCGDSVKTKVTDGVESMKNRIVSENLHDHNAVMSLLREALAIS